MFKKKKVSAVNSVLMPMGVLEGMPATKKDIQDINDKIRAICNHLGIGVSPVREKYKVYDNRAGKCSGQTEPTCDN